jgi:hypothetical protein
MGKTWSGQQKQLFRQPAPKGDDVHIGNFDLSVLLLINRKLHGALFWVDLSLPSEYSKKQLRTTEGNLWLESGFGTLKLFLIYANQTLRDM